MKISENTSQTFLKYFQKTVSPEEHKKMGELFANDRFLSDAAEGFESNPDALNDLNNLKNRFYFNKGIKAKILNKYIFFTAGIIAFAFTSLIVYYKIHKPEVFMKDKTSLAQNEKLQVQDNLVIQEAEISDAFPIAKEIQITSKKIVNDQPKTIVTNAASEQLVVSPIPSKKLKELSKGTSNSDVEKELDKKLITYSNSPIIYIVDLKTVDYSAVYKNRKVVPESSGLESKFESTETKTVFTFENSVHYVSYKSFLETALQKYSEADYKGAVRDFATILKTFPADLNAYFYGGLCMYNLQKTDKAIVYFDQVIESPINTFYQEARWYKALSLIQKNDTESAKQLFTQIIIESGFYSEKAKALLKTLK